ncbi:MAG: IS110 family transposase, partial [Xanthobacteraceae bacterium]
MLGWTAPLSQVAAWSLRRSEVLPLFSRLPPARVGMEACHTSHYWAREIAKFGHDVRM